MSSSDYSYSEYSEPPRIVEGETLIWHSVEVFVEDPRFGWKNNTKVVSSWKALPHGWQFKLVVYPNGIWPEDEGFVSAYICVRPPAMLQGKEWIFPDLQQLRWFTKDDVELFKLTTFPYTLSTLNHFVGRSRLVSHNTIRQKKWVTAGKLRIVCEAAFLPPGNSSCQELPPDLFSKEPEFVTFLLADGSKLYLDKRLVVERSTHFANMLSSETWVEGRTNVIDLRSNEQADVTSMQAVLCHFMSQPFRAACNVEVAFSVRKLADQFCLDDLVQEVEGELVAKVCKDNALQFLGKVIGSGGILEARCLELVKAHASELLEKHRSMLDEIVDDNPALTKFLLRTLLNAARAAGVNSFPLGSASFDKSIPGARRVETLIVHTVLFVMYARITLMTFHAMDTGVLPSSRDVCAMWQWYHGKFDSFEHRLKGEVVLDLIDFFSSMSRFPWDIRAEINKMADPSVGGYCEGSELAPMSIKVALDLCERHPKSMIGFLVAFTALLLLPQLVYSTGALQKVLKNLDAADLVTVSEGEEEAEAEAAIEQSLLNFRKIQHMSRVFGGHIIDSQRRIKRPETNQKLQGFLPLPTKRLGCGELRQMEAEESPPQPLRLDLIRAEFRQICSIDLVGQTFTARLYFEFLLGDAALDAELLKDMDEEKTSWKPKDGGGAPARFYTQHVSWMNAAEPPVVLVNKLVEDGKDLRFSIEVHGVFLQRFECAKFPFDIQDLSVKVEFQLANQGRWPVNISAEKTDNCDVNDAHFIWDNEYMLGKMVSIAVRERRVLPTRTYQHVQFSCFVQRKPFFYLVNVSLPNMLFALMAGVQFFVSLDKVAERAGISLTLLLVCASYYQFSASLRPRIGYFTILDEHSLCCIWLVIVMVFWVGIITSVRSSPETVELIAACCFCGTWFLMHCFFLVRFWMAWRLAKAFLAEPLKEDDREAKAILCKQSTTSAFYPEASRSSRSLTRVVKVAPTPKPKPRMAFSRSKSFT
ncbi:chrng [Symbiodinium microadriaticum]|nr:chrng [Symbiodinium microadriaticum]